MNKTSERINNVVCTALTLLILLPVCGVKGADNKPTLLELARSKFETRTEENGKIRRLYDAEIKLLQKVDNGELADYSDTSVKINDPNNDPNNAKEWDKKTRSIRAKILAWLCTDKEASAMITHKGVWIKGARIDEYFNLSFATIPFPLYFENCAFEGGINLQYADIRGLFLIGTHTGPINADGINIRGNLCFRNGFKAKGEVRMIGATIVGNLDCDNGQFINKGEIALLANSMNIEGSVFLRYGFMAKGEVHLVGTRIGRNLECDNGQFINKGEIALLANSMNIEGSVFLRKDFISKGEVNLVASSIGGNLDCEKGNFINSNKRVSLRADSIDVKGNIYLRNDFQAKGAVNFISAKVGNDIDCQNGLFINEGEKSLNFSGANIVGNVWLNRGFKANGEVFLVATKIGNDLDCLNGQFINKNKKAKALNCGRASIGGDVYLNGGFQAEGEVNLIGAMISGSLNCINCRFANEERIALDAGTAKIEGSVYLGPDFKAEGLVSLVSTNINGNLSSTKSQFINLPGFALQADSISVNGNVILRNKFQAIGKVSFFGGKISKYFCWMDVNSPNDVTLDLRSAKIGTLYDDAKSWPNSSKLLLHGLVYEEIDENSPRDPNSRIKWLRRQPDFRPQPYEQLATVLRKSGQDSDAKDILIAKNEHKAQLSQLAWLEKIWYHYLGPIIGYGYRPQKAIWKIAIIIVFGWFIFGFGYFRGLITPDSESAYVEKGSGIDFPGDKSRQLSKVYPKFNYFMYSIDVFVPLIDLHQAKYWLPNAISGHELFNINGFKLHTGGLLRIYLWIHLIMGWTLTTMLVVGLTGLIRT